jgi:hypothetical protein
MDWTRVEGGAMYVGRYRGIAVEVTRSGPLWQVLVGRKRLLIRNPRLKTWLSARTVVEHVIRGQIDGPASATASVGHVGQENVGQGRSLGSDSQPPTKT